MTVTAVSREAPGGICPSLLASEEFTTSQREQVLDRDAVLLGQPLGDQRAVTCLGVALDTEQRCGPAARQRRNDRREVGAVEDFGGVAAGVLGGELAARALADPLAVILGILELA